MNGQATMVLEIPSDLQAIPRTVESVMQQCCRCASDSPRLAFDFRIGLTEALSNAMLYGNAQDPTKRVRVEVCLGDEKIMVRVSDEGNGFDPGSVPDPTLPRNIEKPCGRGIFLMRQLVDEVRFNDEGNCVTLVLHLESSRELGGGARA